MVELQQPLWLGRDRIEVLAKKGKLGIKVGSHEGSNHITSG